MRRLLLWLCLAVLPAAAGEVLLEESFEGPNLPAGWETMDGQWSIQDGKLVGGAKGYLSRVMLPVEPRQNVALEADVAFLKVAENTRWLALVTRQAPEGKPFLLFTHRVDRRAHNGLEVSCQTAENKWRILATQSAPLAPTMGEVHRLRVELRDELEVGYIDGQEVIRAELPSEMVSTGRVGFLVSSVTASFDNVTVEALAPRSAEERRADLLAQCGSPLVIAHRGFSAQYPENTLAAFRAAFDAGADVVETDVRLTKDGVLVLSHDADLKRCSNGQGGVASMTLAELRQYDYGSWRDPKFKGEPIPTLEEALLAIKGRGAMALDLKVRGINEQLAAVLEQTGMADNVIACPWSALPPDELADLTRRLPKTPVTVIGRAPRTVPDGYFQPFLERGVRGFWYDYGSLTLGFVRAAQRRALSVYAWTVNDPALMARVARLGVDGILTDDPATLKTVLEELVLKQWE